MQYQLYTKYIPTTIYTNYNTKYITGGSRAAPTSKMKCFVIIVNGFQPLTIIAKHSILDVAAAIDPPLYILSTSAFKHPSGTFGQWLCKIVTGYFLIFLLFDISAFLLVAIAIERRKAVVKPLSTLDPPPLTNTLLVICAIALLGFVTQTPTIYGSHYAAKMQRLEIPVLRSTIKLAWNCCTITPLCLTVSYPLLYFLYVSTKSISIFQQNQ